MSISIPAGIAAVKASLDVGKSIRELIQKPNIDAHAVEGQLHEMLIHLGNVHFALNDAALEIQELRRALDRQEALQALKADMEFSQDGAFWLRKSEKAAGMMNPYCPICWGRDQKAVPLTPMAAGSFRCAIHNAMYTTESSREAQRQRQEKKRADDDFIGIIPGPSPWT